MAGSKRADQDRSIRVNKAAPIAPAAIVDRVGGYLVPVDPMEDLQCESCQ
jgi:hypothetical protein